MFKIVTEAGELLGMIRNDDEGVPAVGDTVKIEHILDDGSGKPLGEYVITESLWVIKSARNSWADGYAFRQLVCRKKEHYERENKS